jgi:hypothetical protein
MAQNTLRSSQDQGGRINANQRREAFLNYLEQAREKETLVDDIPKKVQKAYGTRYPAGESVGWVRINRELYGVFFLDKVWFKYARFTGEGEWEDTRVFSLSREARQRTTAILNKIVKEDFEILQLERIIKPSGEKLWEVLVETDSGMIRIMLDENDKLISRVEVESGAAAPDADVDVVPGDDVEVDDDSDEDDDLLASDDDGGADDDDDED